MVVHRRKKVVKYRGHTTHGGGHRKKRRGAGSRGGRGNAGTGKRSGHKKDKYHHRLGSHGFVSKRPLPGKAVNLGYFTSDRLAQLVKEGKAVQEKGLVTVNVNVLGYHKLLGTGKVGAKVRFIVSSWSTGVEERLKAMGGTVVRPDKPDKVAAHGENTKDVKAAAHGEVTLHSKVTPSGAVPVPTNPKSGSAGELPAEK